MGWYTHVKTAGLVLAFVGPLWSLRRPLCGHPRSSPLRVASRLTPSPRCRAPSGTPVGLTFFAVSSFLKDAVNRLGDLADDGQPNDAFKT